MQRIAEVSQMSFSTMFDLQHIKEFVEVCKGVKDHVHIILNVFEIEFWVSIFKKNQIPYSISNKTKTKQFYNSKRVEDCKIHFVNNQGVLGREFNNVIFVASNAHLGLSNTKTGDLFECPLLQ